MWVVYATREETTLILPLICITIQHEDVYLQHHPTRTAVNYYLHRNELEFTAKFSFCTFHLSIPAPHSNDSYQRAFHNSGKLSH